MKQIGPLTQSGESRVYVCEVPEHGPNGEHTHVPCLRIAAYLVVDTETGEKWPLCQHHGDMAKEKGWVE
jgi:hypothetical protein